MSSRRSQGVCERKIEVFEKIHKKKINSGVGGGGVFRFGAFGLGGQGGCERRIEVFVKIHKN